MRFLGPDSSGPDDLATLDDVSEGFSGNMRYRGTYAPGSRPTGAGVLAGDSYTADSSGYEGTLPDRVRVDAGDLIIALVDDPSATEWLHTKTTAGALRHAVNAVAPDANADALVGYQAGSLRVQSGTGLLFVCVDSTPFSASWARVQPSTASTSSSGTVVLATTAEAIAGVSATRVITAATLAAAAAPLRLGTSKPATGDHDLTVAECNTPTRVLVDGGTVGFDDFASVAVGAWGIVTALDAGGLTWDLTGLTTAQPSPNLTVTEGQSMSWHKTDATEVAIDGGTSA